MTDDRKPQDQPRARATALDDKQSFKKDDGQDQTIDKQAKDGIGRMGEKAGPGKPPLDVD